MQANLGIFLSPKSEIVECGNEDFSEFYSCFDHSAESRPDNFDRNERKRVKNCHRERCRVQKLNCALHHLNMLLPQPQRNPPSGKHFSKAIILETCCEFIYQLENHVFGLFFEKSESGDECSSSESYLSSLINARRDKYNSEGKREAMRIKRPKNSFILFSMGQRKQLLKENPCLDNNKVSKILGERWKNLDQKAKADFNQLAKIEKSNHKLKFPHFNYTIKRKRPRPITTKSVEAAVADYLERDGSYRKLSRLMAGFPPKVSVRDFLLSSFSQGAGDCPDLSEDAVKLEDSEQLDSSPSDTSYSQQLGPSYGFTPPLSLPELFPPQHPFGWPCPFDDPLYLQQAMKHLDGPLGYPVSSHLDYGYMGYQEVDEELVTLKEEFDYDDDVQQLPDSTQSPAEFLTPNILYYPLSPTQKLSQFEPDTSTYPHVPLFALPPISQLISHEN